MTETELMALLEDAVLARPGSLSRDQRLKQVDGWDSVAQVAMAGDVFDRWGLRVSADDVLGCDTIGELFDRVLALGGGG